MFGKQNDICPFPVFPQNPGSGNIHAWTERRIEQNCTELPFFLEDFFRARFTWMQPVLENLETFRSRFQVRIASCSVVVVIQDIPVFVDNINVNAMDTIQDTACG